MPDKKPKQDPTPKDIERLNSAMDDSKKFLDALADKTDKSITDIDDAIGLLAVHFKQLEERLNNTDKKLNKVASRLGL